MKLVVLAAGMGSRYGGLKQLDPMTENGEVIVDFSVYDAILAGFDEVVFIIKKENQEIFDETVKKRMEGKIKVTFAYQDISMLPEGYTVPEGRVKPWGTGHALLCAKEAIGDDCFAVINADDFYGRDTYMKIGKFLKENKDNKGAFCMGGFILKNTLTENGTVSRGICKTDDNNYLVSIVERTKIQRVDGETVFFEDGVMYPTDENGYASMNCWGFTSKVFDFLGEYFKDFLDTKTGNEEKKEFYLPAAVGKGMENGLCTVKVLPTDAKWYGVTYAEDKPFVKSSIRGHIESGEYPDGLWK